MPHQTLRWDRVCAPACLLVVLTGLETARGAAPPHPPVPLIRVSRPNWKPHLVAVHPKGFMAAVIGEYQTPKGSYFEVERYALWDGKVKGIATFSMRNIAFSPGEAAFMRYTWGGQYLIFGSSGVRMTLEASDKVNGPPVAPGARLFVASFTGDSGRVERVIELPPWAGYQAMELLPDDRTLVLSSRSDAAILFDTQTLKVTATLSGDEHKPSPDPIAPLLWELLEKGKMPKDAIKLLPGAVDETSTVKFAVSRGGEYLAISTRGGWVSVWDLKAHKRLWRIRQARSSPFHVLTFSPDGETLVGKSIDTEGVAWRTRDGRFVGKVGGDRFFAGSRYFTSAPAKFVGFQADGRTLIFDCKNKVGFIGWDAATGRFLGDSWAADSEKEATRMLQNNNCSQAMLSADGRTLAFVKPGQEFVVYDVHDIWPRP